jgi:hypothetical protein
MSVEPLTERIAAALSGKSDSREIADVIADCTQREQEIYRRWEAIDSEKKTADVEVMIKLNGEIEVLQNEEVMLDRQLEPLQRSLDQAQQREAPALVPTLLKAFPAVLEKAERAKAAWLAARQDLTGHLGKICQQRALARAGKHPTKSITEAQFNQVVAVFDWLPKDLNPSNLESRLKVSHAAKWRAIHLDENPEVARTKIWRAAGFGHLPTMGIYRTEDEE